MHSATVANLVPRSNTMVRVAIIILNQLETSSNGLYAVYETLRPLVAPSLCSGCYSLRPSGFLKINV